MLVAKWVSQLQVANAVTFRLETSGMSGFGPVSRVSMMEPLRAVRVRRPGSRPRSPGPFPVSRFVPGTVHAGSHVPKPHRRMNNGSTAARVRSFSAALLSVVLPGCEEPAARAEGGVAVEGAGMLAATTAGHAHDPVARGRYLTEGLLQCFICHSERAWDEPGAPPIESRKGAGLVWRDDGTHRLVAANLTPDPETGIGRRTDEQLARAIREGIAHDGRALHGAMPEHRHLTDQDVAAVIAYLRSLPPVHHPLPRTALAPEEQARYDAAPPPELKPAALTGVAEPVERGRRLVAAANCVGCHTSWHSKRMPGLLGGGNLIERGERAAYSTNLTPHPSGSPYDAAAFLYIMRTGKGGTLSPLMPWAVYRHLSDEDLDAIHAFLRTMHPVAHSVGNSGKATYCEVCGQEHPLGELNKVERPAGVAVDPRLYDGYVGVYRSNEYGFTITVLREGDRLLAREEGRLAAEMIPLSETRFVTDGGVAPVRFVLDGQGRAARLVSEEVEDIVLERVP